VRLGLGSNTPILLYSRPQRFEDEDSLPAIAFGLLPHCLLASDVGTTRTACPT
jgi:hypothetical protein